MIARYLALTGAAFLATGALAATPQKAQISMKLARAKALAQIPGGRIKSAELETEKGRLVYSFDIAAPRKAGIEEVQISAIDGRLVSRTHESPAKEKQEARAEAKEQKRR
jgi:hypothetical protein